MILRALNIAFRTAHIATTSVLVGGLVFGVERDRLDLSLGLTIATGLGLVAVEIATRPHWLREGRGLMTMVKLAVLSTVPWASDARLPILVTAITVASVGSHMPARFRYFPFSKPKGD
ncbi:MAG: hypothetical protein CL477_18985 [Acidobacteria bacterium]|jgi:hypothetical protein|nr:hypothetical protein [Acidobacteriota bacterium]HJN46387.1 hypothetical protein [Vicinamibacterales bacterium]|tara:strand:+ start:319 stop:672 length:354 start_codon:yes stop_codon:yes gene_type:complete